MEDFFFSFFTSKTRGLSLRSRPLASYIMKKFKNVH